jgi:hypothetical protein
MVVDDGMDPSITQNEICEKRNLGTYAFLSHN